MLFQSIIVPMIQIKNDLFYYLLGITLIFFSLYSYDSLCQRGSEYITCNALKVEIHPHRHHILYSDSVSESF